MSLNLKRCSPCELVESSMEALWFISLCASSLHVLHRYVLAHLKHIKYLDYRLVDQQAVAAAKEQYQVSFPPM